MVIWIVGLSGSGKTTIGQEIFRLWKAREPATVLLDGDDVRRMLQHDKKAADYSVEGRRKNAMRIVEMCSWLDRQNINVICCILCIFNDIMNENRKRFSQYFQVYLETPMQTLKKRDPKGLYKKAACGEEKNVVGVDMPFTPPLHSDLTISTDHNAPDPQVLAANIMKSTGLLS